MSDIARDQRPLGLFGLANLLLDARRLLVLLPLGAAALALAVSFAMPTYYMASTSFVPESRTTSQLPAGLSALAGQFGLPLSIEPSKSPQFYADLLRSRTLLERTVQTRFAAPGTADSTSLLDSWGIKGADSLTRLDKGVRRLSNDIVLKTNTQTNVVELDVLARHPWLAAAIANRLIAYLNEFNATSRQSQARARRIFIEQQIAQAQKDLSDAEDALRAFLMHNRTYRGYPELELEADRLQRRITLRQEVYTSLYRDYESARIEEVNDTPVITVIDPGEQPVMRARPSRKGMTVTGFAIGALLALGWVFGREFVGTAGRAEVAAYDTFRESARLAFSRWRRARAGLSAGEGR